MRRNLVFWLLSMFLLVGCSQDNEVLEKQDAKEVVLKTKVSPDVIRNVNQGLEGLASMTRAGINISENDAKLVLQPLVPIGEDIRQEFLTLAESGQLDVTQEEMDELKMMNDTQLAEMAYYIGFVTETSAIGSIGNTGGGQPNVEIDPLEYSRQDIIDCLMATIGLNDIENFKNYIGGTRGMIAAKTAMKLAYNFCKRTLGWVGLAITIYDFGKCLQGKAR